MKLAILILFVCSFNSLESGISFIYGENSLKGISLTEDVSFGLTRPAIDSSFTVVLKDVYKDDVLRVPWSGQQEDELNNNSKISIQNSFFSDGGYLSTNSIGYSDPYSGRPYIFTPRDLGITYLFSDFVDNPLRLTEVVSENWTGGLVMNNLNRNGNHTCLRNVEYSLLSSRPRWPWKR
jgi:hypothetical protein